MKILLVNPNRYKSPPVPPIGLEYIAASLEDKGHSAEILDLCFAEDVGRTLHDTLTSFRPDIAGVTVRNVDSVLYHTNEFFLDEIKDIIYQIKAATGLKVIIGGTGISANPEGILGYLNADFAVAGPGEHVVHEVFDAMVNPGNSRRVFRGTYSSHSACIRKPTKIDYRTYCDAGGIAGFETHKGCSSSCVYCMESGTPVAFKNPDDVIRELKHFVDSGLTRFHLCDSEFNENLDYSVDFCTALKKAGLDMQWALYMKPSQFSRTLFRLLKDTGAYLITLSVDSWKKCDQYWAEYEKFVFNAKSCGIRIAVDFLTGFPNESADDLLRHFENLRRPLPDSISVNTYIRLYKSLKITDIIMHDRGLWGNLSGDTGNKSYIKPVFYNHIATEKLSELIGGDMLFRIEGPEKIVNYLRAESIAGT